MSMLFAATYPERVTALILGSAAARWFPAADYPCGRGTEETYVAMREIAAHRWGRAHHRMVHAEPGRARHAPAS